MSNRVYLCRNCGELRRTSAVYPERGQRWETLRETAAWPKHCDEPMTVLSFPQGVAATRIDAAKRVGWAAAGLHILQRGGREKWAPALNQRQIEEAKEQVAEFRARHSHRYGLTPGTPDAAQAQPHTPYRTPRDGRSSGRSPNRTAGTGPGNKADR